MESSNEQRTKIRHDINTRLDALEDLLKQELDKKLLERDQSFAKERQHYIQDIDALRLTAARVEELEKENDTLLAELEAAKRQNQPRSGREGSRASKGIISVRSDIGSNTGTVDVKEYERVKDMLAVSDRDYESMLYARQALEVKLRYYKDMTKHWREYRDRWMLRYPKDGLKTRSIQEADAAKTSPRATTGEKRYSSIPAPPSLPDGMTLSVSDASRDVSPRTDLGGVQDRPRGSPSLVPQPLPDRCIATKRALKDGHRASSGDLTEASDESGQPQSPSSRAGSKVSNVVNGADGKNQVETISSSPIIVSERSLKRKRPIKDGPRSNPVSVKDEKCPSSPTVALVPLQSGGLYDSLDLDDVGGHIDTPRKRRRLREMQYRSSLMSPTATRNEERMLDDSTVQEIRSDSPIKDELDKQTISNLNPFSPNSATNPGDQDNEEEERRSRKALSKAQQQAHNKRVSERLDVADQPFSSDSRFSKPTSAKCTSRRISDDSKSSATKGFSTSATEHQFEPRTPQGRHEQEQRNTALASPTILQPTDANARILPRTHEKFAVHKLPCPPSRRDRGAAYVPALAEDGEDLDSPVVNTKLRTKQADTDVSAVKLSKATDIHHRLGTLLSEPSPAKSLIGLTTDQSSPSKNESGKTPTIPHNGRMGSKAPFTHLNIPAQRSTPIVDTTGNASSKQYKATEGEMSDEVKSAQTTRKAQQAKSAPRKLRSSEQSADTRPEHEPLRARPMHRLRIEDFRLNPAHGDYAYHESVRKHDEKKALSGCTDRNCQRCKNIRQFVESSGYARIPGQDQEETDRQLLESFLGKDHKSRLKKISAEERKELLLQAKAQQFANDFGKHRVPFQRAQSPVDYWNVGFPSTQEQMQNREAVRMREREKVKEMYWEAIRERGRYIFADER